MRKLYINLSMVVGILFMFALGASAQKAIYAAVAATEDGSKGGIFKLNAEDPHAAAPERLCTLEDMVMGGAMVVDETEGNKYYAMCADVSGNPTDFCLIDFETGETTKLGDASKVNSLFYDATNKVMYAIALYAEVVDQVEKKGSRLYTVDLSNGTMTMVKEWAGTQILTACIMGANTYGIGVDHKIYPIRADHTFGSARVLYPSGTSSSPDAISLSESNSQALISDGTKMYWLGYGLEKGKTSPICFLATLNSPALSAPYAKIANDGSLSIAEGKIHFTGMALEMTTSKEPETVPFRFYASLYEDVMGGYPKGILTIDPENPYVAHTSSFVTLECVSAAAEAEGVYYAMCMVEYSAVPTKFYSVNLETKEKKELGTATSVADMAYDKKNKTMYAVSKSDTGTVISSVNLTNGALTVVSAIKGIMPSGLAIDDAGKMYVLGAEGKLYVANLAENKLNLVATLTTTTIGRAQSLTYSNKKLYWMVGDPMGSYLAEINVRTGKVTRIGTGNFANMVVLTGLYVPEDYLAMRDNEMKVVTIETYGDHMGSTPESQCSQVETFYYDKEDNLLRSSIRGYRFDDRTKLDPMKYFTYIYNDKGLLEKSFYRQYGSYDGNYTLYGEPKGEVTYEYDAEGRLTRKNDYGNNDYFLYTWEGNNLVKEVNMRLRYGTTDDWYAIQTLIYSDFVEGADNLPRKVDSEGAYASQEFIGYYTYDERNNKTSYITYDLEEVTKKSKQEWEYNETGVLIQTRKFKVVNNEFVLDNDKVTNYTTEGNKTKIKTNNTLTHKVETVQELAPETAPKNLTVESISEEASPNSYKLTWENPDYMGMLNPAFDIYRDGIYLGRTAETTYEDKEVENDLYTHDYFVQTVSDSEEGFTFSISNAVTLDDVKTELTGVTGIKCDSHEIKADKKISVTLVWNAPESVYLPQSYNVYLGNSKMPINSIQANNTIIPILETTYVANFGSSEYPDYFSQKVTVEAVYAIGRIKTETIIDLNDHVHEGPDNIENNTDVPAIEINGNELLVNGEYTALDIYNVNGMIVKRAEGEATVDMSFLSEGIYVVRLVKDGKVSILKAVRK